MATLVSGQSGNFTAAGTWRLSNTTAELDSELGSTATTTSFVASSSFTPGAITIDAIGVKIASRTASPTGTFSVDLFNTTAAAPVAGTQVNINASDIHINAGGWYFFKFAAPVLLLAATLYQVRVRSSVAGTVTLFRNVTAGNWSRILRTTTTAAPASTDKLIICGDYLNASVVTPYIVTMNNTTSVTTFGEVAISNGGTLDWGTSASTAYYLKIAGNLNIYGGGVYSMGTSGTPMPSTSTASLEFANTSNVQFGLEARLGSTLIGYGATKTVKAFLTADTAVSATISRTDVVTGWLSGDSIAFSSTTRTNTESEIKVLGIDSVGTTITTTAMVNARSGTAPTKASVASINRNVKIFGTSVVNQAYINIANSAIVDLNFVEIFQMGSNTASKRGIDVATTIGSISIRNSVIRNFSVTGSTGILVTGASSNNYTIDNNVFWQAGAACIVNAATTGTNYSITNNLIMRSLGNGITLADLNGVITGNIAISTGGYGIQYSDLLYTTGIVDNNTAHSNAGVGHVFLNVTTINDSLNSFTNFITWRNNTYGMTLSNVEGITIDGITAFGNTTTNIDKIGNGGFVTLKNIVSNAGTTLTCPIGLSLSADSPKIFIENSSFGATTTHATGDMSVRVSNVFIEAYFRNCLFNSPNKIINTAANMTRGSIISSARHQQTAGNHIAFKKYGSSTIDNTIFYTSAPSEKLIPVSATLSLKSGIKKFAVPAGKSATVSVFVRKSLVGDGGAYLGSQPRLVVEADPSIGINSDIVLMTAVSFNGVWEKLSGTTPVITDNGIVKVFVDCRSTTGFINVDSWEVN